MELKFKIKSVSESLRGIDVQYYTDAIVAAQEPVWSSRTAQLVFEGALPEAARAQAEYEYPAGAHAHLTFYDSIPSGGALKEFILRGAPLAWLEIRDASARGEVFDMSAVKALEGVEQSVVTLPKPVTAIPNIQITKV